MDEQPADPTREERAARMAAAKAALEHESIPLPENHCEPMPLPQNLGFGPENDQSRLKVIRHLMAKAKPRVRGNPKDWCVVAGDQVMDYRGRHAMKHQETGVAIGSAKILLVRKDRIGRLFGPEVGDFFWNRKLGTRRHYPREDT